MMSRIMTYIRTFRLPSSLPGLRLVEARSFLGAKS